MMTTEARNTTKTETESEISIEAATGREKNIRRGRAPTPARVTEAGVQEILGAVAGVVQENTRDSEETGVRVTRVGGLGAIRVGLE